MCICLGGWCSIADSRGNVSAKHLNSIGAIGCTREGMNFDCLRALASSDSSEFRAGTFPSPD